MVAAVVGDEDFVAYGAVAPEAKHSVPATAAAGAEGRDDDDTNLRCTDLAAAPEVEYRFVPLGPQTRGFAAIVHVHVHVGGVEFLRSFVDYFLWGGQFQDQLCAHLQYPDSALHLLHVQIYFRGDGDLPLQNWPEGESRHSTLHEMKLYVDI